MDVNKIEAGYLVTQSVDGDPHIQFVPQPREHNTESLECWCKPEILRLCSECDGSEDGCWACDGGTIEVPAQQAAFESGPFIVVHHP